MAENLSDFLPYGEECAAQFSDDIFMADKAGENLVLMLDNSYRQIDWLVDEENESPNRYWRAAEALKTGRQYEDKLFDEKIYQGLKITGSRLRDAENTGKETAEHIYSDFLEGFERSAVHAERAGDLKSNEEARNLREGVIVPYARGITHFFVPEMGRSDVECFTEAYGHPSKLADDITDLKEDVENGIYALGRGDLLDAYTAENYSEFALERLSDIQQEFIQADREILGELLEKYPEAEERIRRIRSDAFIPVINGVEKYSGCERDLLDQKQQNRVEYNTD